VGLRGSFPASPAAYPTITRRRSPNPLTALTKSGENVTRHSTYPGNPGLVDIALEWRNGLYLPVDPGRMTYSERLDAEKRRGKACQEFLDALDRTARQGVSLSDSKRAGNYAPKLMVERNFANGFSATKWNAPCLRCSPMSGSLRPSRSARARAGTPAMGWFVPGSAGHEVALRSGDTTPPQPAPTGPMTRATSSPGCAGCANHDPRAR
jgi:hypothetical protein